MRKNTEPGIDPLLCTHCTQTVPADAMTHGRCTRRCNQLCGHQLQHRLQRQCGAGSRVRSRRLAEKAKSTTLSRCDAYTFAMLFKLVRKQGMEPLLNLSLTILLLGTQCCCGSSILLSCAFCSCPRQRRRETVFICDRRISACAHGETRCCRSQDAQRRSISGTQS